MYHLELRQFPHNLCHFNLTERELHAIAGPWVRGQWLDVGERTWDPRRAKVTIVEGPEVPPGQLTMGRGWRHAQRYGQDVTEQVLDAARRAAQAGASDASSRGPAAVEQPPNADLSALLGEGGSALLAAWRSAAARFPGLPPSECLALAERELDQSRAS